MINEWLIRNYQLVFMIFIFVRTRLRIDLKYFSAISNIVLRILPRCNHAYHHDNDDDSVSKTIVHEENFFGKLKEEV